MQIETYDTIKPDFDYSKRKLSIETMMRIAGTESGIYKNMKAIFFVKDGKTHRDNDEPAIIYKDGSRHWYQNGRIHRDNDLPAALEIDGAKWWFLNGRCHRDNDLPACITAEGTQRWHLNGRLHRDNGPAIIGADGTRSWLLNNELHRADGPASVDENGGMLFAIRGRKIMIDSTFPTNYVDWTDEHSSKFKLMYDKE